MAPHATTSPAPRFLFIDLLRGWAVFVMIETHVVNALLDPSIKAQSFFTFLSFINGLVAPAFLFCAGAALGITLNRRWNELIGMRRYFWRYILRLVFIFVIAYSLHLPFFSFTKLAHITDPHVWITFYQADILQIIVLSLLFTVVLALLVRNRNLFTLSAAIIGIALVFITPVVRDSDTSGMVPWIRPYFTTSVKSQFPIFPWSAFLLGGTLVADYFVRMREKGDEESWAKKLALLSVILCVVAMAAEVAPFQIYPNHSFFRYSPEFFFVRFALIVLILLALWKYAVRIPSGGNSVISVFGQESLLVYVVHLMIVYGYDYEFSFVRMFSPQLNYLECFGLFVVLTAVMYGMAFVWHRLKGWNKPIASTVEFAVLGMIVVTFFVRGS